MKTTQEDLKKEVELLEAEASRVKGSVSQEERDGFHEKMADVKAALKRVLDYGEDAIDELKERGEDVWGDFRKKLDDARRYVRAKLEKKG